MVKGKKGVCRGTQKGAPLEIVHFESGFGKVKKDQKKDADAEGKKKERYRGRQQKMPLQIAHFEAAFLGNSNPVVFGEAEKKVFLRSLLLCSLKTAFVSTFTLPAFSLSPVPLPSWCCPCTYSFCAGLVGFCFRFQWLRFGFVFNGTRWNSMMQATA